MWFWLSSNSSRRPLCLELRSAEWFITATVSIAVFSEVFLYAVVVPVLPFALTVRAGVDANDVQKWTSVLLAVYAAFLLVFSPIAGWVADKTTTRRGPLLFSLITFTGATILLMLGRSIGALVAGRALQGASAAAVWSIGLALLVDTVGVDQIGEAMGYISLAMSAGIFCGPLLGGVVYDKGGYYAVYGMCLGVIALDVILRLVLIEKHIANRWLIDEQTQADSNGTNTNTEKRVEATPGETLRPSAPDVTRGHPMPAPCPAESAGPTAALDGVEEPSRSANAMTEDDTVPKESSRHVPAVFVLLSSRRLLVALWGTFVAAIINSTFDAVIPLRVANLFGWNSIGAGLIFLAVVIPTFASPVIGKLVDRVGARLITTLGFTILCPALVCLRFVDHNSIDQKVLLCVLLVIAGGASSMLLVPVLAEITHCVESTQNKHPEKFGVRGAFAQGYGVMNVSYALGVLIGPIWGGFTVESAGWGTATWSIGLLAGISAIPMFLCLGGWIGRRGWRAELFRPKAAITRKADAPRISLDGRSENPGDQV